MKKIVIASLFILLSISVNGCGKEDKTADVNTTENTEVSGTTEEKSDAKSGEETKVSDDSGDSDSNKDSAEAADENDSEMPAQDEDLNESDNRNSAVILDGLVVDWADYRKSDLSDYDEIDVVDGDYKTGLLFTATADIDEFKLYDMEIKGMNSEGKLSFNRSKVYGPAQILVEMPLVLNVTFPGDMSAYGFSYMYNGIEKFYSVMVSGKDGSLVVEEVNMGYPDDTVTIPFTEEYEYHSEYYTDIAKKGTLDVSEIDNTEEGISDMLYIYHSDDDTTEYEDANGISVSQEFYTDSYYGTRVTHATVWTENELMDPVMKKVGYKEYEVNYFYPFGAWIPAGEYEIKPSYVSMYIDGNGYDYYFAMDELVRRSGPDGMTDNPQTNDFINSIYKIGCYYGNTLVGERNRYSLTLSSFDCIEKKGDSYALTGQIWGRNMSGTFVIDENTVFDKDFDKDVLQGIKDGESFYDWYVRAYNAIENQEDWIESSALLGIWELRTTDGHVDSVYGTYWWD